MRKVQNTQDTKDESESDTYEGIDPPEEQTRDHNLDNGFHHVIFPEQTY